jgi:DNA repair exonuclease SbcCD ATPase subunit
MSESPEWRLNYFNYFTEIEEHFQKARGTSLFLLSPLDWALIESWKAAGVPLEAALKGIDEAFDKWRARPKRTQMINGLAYCTQAVMDHAQRAADNAPAAEGAAPAEADSPFPRDSVLTHLEKAAAQLDALPGYEEVAASLRQLAQNLDLHFHDLQELDQRLTALEDKMAALARTRLSDEDLFRMRRELDLQLRPYRGKMSTDQIAKLEKAFLDRTVYDRFSLPRLSLFFVT